MSEDVDTAHSHAQNEKDCEVTFGIFETLFKILIWFFPAIWFYAWFMAAIGTAGIFCMLHFPYSESLFVVVYGLGFIFSPPLVFIYLTARSRWFRRNAFVLFVSWFVVYLFTCGGYTQGAISSALKKVYFAIQKQVDSSYK